MPVKLPKFYGEDFSLYPANAGLNRQLDCYESASMVNRRLDEFEKSCKRVYGRIDGNFGWFDEAKSIATHYALIFDAEPIDQAVSKYEILAALKNIKLVAQATNSIYAPLAIEPNLKELVDRIEKFGVK